MVITRCGFAALLLSVLFAASPAMAFGGEGTTHNATCGGASCGLELFHEGGGEFFAPIMDTSVEVNVSGPAVYTSLTQTFTNPTDYWVEGIYRYPLPNGAAVNQLHMKIGERLIVGEIKEKEAAEKAYLKAKASGKKTSLVNAQRPNIFTTKLANLGPQESVEIQIDFFLELPISSDTQQLRFPMVVGPRYTPPSTVSSQPKKALATTEHSLSEINVSEDTLPPIQTLTTANPEHHPHTLSVDLNLGVALNVIRSLYHPIDIQQVGETEYEIRLATGSTIPNRDFVLEFSPAPQDKPKTALLSEVKNGFHYGLLMVMPPTANTSPTLPREITFIFDRSGSMGGTSIVQAKAALIHALEQLTIRDRFNVIWFNDNQSSLFPEIVAATPGNLARARAVVSQVQASGGTEMLGALKPALNAIGSPGFVQQVIFITDGNVSNEAALFSFIERNLDERRLFTVGIGSAPNQYFLQHAAMVGRGLHTFIGDTQEVQSQMNKLFLKLAQPMLRDLAIEANSDNLEFWPQSLPDLYADEPMSIAFRTKSPPKNIGLSGKLPESHWTATATLNGGQQRQGIAELWANRKITNLMNDYRRHRNNPKIRDKTRELILDTALSHHLVSKFTSIVAVDKTPSNLTLEPNKNGHVPRHQPHGWTLGGRAQLPQTGTDAKLRIILGALILSLIGAGWIWRQISASEQQAMPHG